MSRVLGPRVLSWRSGDGRSGEITIEITDLSLHGLDIGDGDTMEEVHGTISISSSWFSRTLHSVASDDLQAIFHLLRAADIYIQKICRDNGVEVDTSTPGELIADFGTFR